MLQLPAFGLQNVDAMTGAISHQVEQDHRNHKMQQQGLCQPDSKQRSGCYGGGFPRRVERGLFSGAQPARPAEQPGEARIVRGKRRQPKSESLAVPPLALLVPGLGEGVSIQDRSNIAGRLVREWIRGEKAECVCVVVKKLPDQVEYPRIFGGNAHRGEPHLPIEPQLIRRYLWRHFCRIDGQTFVGIRLPFGGVVAHIRIRPFENNVQPFPTHGAKCAICIHQMQRGSNEVFMIWFRENMFATGLMLRSATTPATA